MRLLKALILSLAALFATSAIAQATAETAKTQYIDVNGNKIGYRSMGQGSPLVLANRMRGTLDTWDPLFINTLAKTHRVIIFDYPGTGYSQGKLPTDFRLVGDFIRDFTARIGVTRFAMAGWSWGGYATQTMVTDHPNLLTHAVFIGTNPPGENKIPIQQFWIDRALHPINDLDDEVVLFFDPRWPDSREAAKASRDRIYARPGVVDRIPSKMEEFQAFFQGHEGFRADSAGRREKLRNSAVPIMILCGDNDTSVPAENWYPLVGQIPRGQFIVLPHSGHGPQHQYPELSARYIVDFIKSE